jgi:hypothetical protein
MTNWQALLFAKMTVILNKLQDWSIDKMTNVKMLNRQNDCHNNQM